MLIWNDDVLEWHPDPPCFGPAKYGCRCRRPRGHQGPHRERPLGGEETSPSSNEITRAYSRRRRAKLRAAGATKLSEIPGETAYRRAKKGTDR